MIRKTVIGLLTVAALATLAITIASFACRSVVPLFSEPPPPSYRRFFLRSRAFTRSVLGPTAVDQRGGGFRVTVEGVFKEVVTDHDTVLAAHAHRARLSIAHVSDAPKGSASSNSGLFLGYGTLWGLAVGHGVITSPVKYAPTRYLIVYFPLWAPLLLFAAYPTLALIRGPVRRWRRRKHGLCIHCGYNLTGLTEARCPECGQEI